MVLVVASVGRNWVVRYKSGVRRARQTCNADILVPFEFGTSGMYNLFQSFSKKTHPNPHTLSLILLHHLDICSQNLDI